MKKILSLVCALVLIVLGANAASAVTQGVKAKVAPRVAVEQMKKAQLESFNLKQDGRPELGQFSYAVTRDAGVKPVRGTKSASPKKGDGSEVVDEHGIIIEPAAGDTTNYKRLETNTAFYYSDGTRLAYQSGKAMIVECADGTVYWKDPLSTYASGAWIKGKKEGTTLTFPTKQPLTYVSSYNTTLSARWGLFDTSKFSAADTYADNFIFDIVDDTLLVMRGTEATIGTTPTYFPGLFWDDDDSFQGYGDCGVTLIEQKPITKRDTVDVVSNTMTYNDFIASNQAVQFYAGEDAVGYSTFLVTSKNATSVEGTFDIYVGYSFANPDEGSQIGFEEGKITVASEEKGIRLTGWVIGDDDKYYRLNWFKQTVFDVRDTVSFRGEGVTISECVSSTTGVQTGWFYKLAEPSTGYSFLLQSTVVDNKYGTFSYADKTLGSNYYNVFDPQGNRQQFMEGSITVGEVGDSIVLDGELIAEDEKVYILHFAQNKKILNYDTDAPFTASFTRKDVVRDYGEGYAMIEAQNATNQAISLVLFTGTNSKTIPAGTYAISDTQEAGTALKSVGVAGGYLTECWAGTVGASGIEDCWFMVEGTITVAEDGAITIDAKNSWEQDVKATIEAPLAATGLSKQILEAIEGKKAGETATVDVTEDTELNISADAGLVNLVINGNGKKVIVREDAQITTQSTLWINNLNFDCAEATIAPIGLPEDADESLHSTEQVWIDKYAPSKEVYFDEGQIRMNGCNFSGLKHSLIAANNKWALHDLVINNSIVQIDYTTSEPVLNWTKNGTIKNLKLNNSTFYNLQKNSSAYFIKYNGTNGAVQNIYKGGTDGDQAGSFDITNCTFVQTMTGKDFANSYSNVKTNLLTWKNNVFFDTYRINKVGANNKRMFTAADNAICGITNPVDNTDKANYATEDTLLKETFIVPTEALDFTKIADLVNNFAPSATSYAGSHGFGDLRWAPTVKPNLTASLLHVKVGEKVAPAISSYSTGELTIEVLTPELVKIEDDSLVALAAGEAKLKIKQAAVAPFEEDSIKEAKFNIVEVTEKPIAETAVGIFRPLFGDDANGYLLGEPSTTTIGEITVTPTVGDNVEYADVPKNDLYDGLRHKVYANDYVFFPSVEKSEIDPDTKFGFEVNISEETPMNIDSLDVLLPVGNAYMWRVQITNEKGDTLWRSYGKDNTKDIKVDSYNQATCMTNQFIATADTVKIAEATAAKLVEQGKAANEPVAGSLPLGENLKSVTGKLFVDVYYWNKATKSLSYEKVFLHMSKNDPTGINDLKSNILQNGMQSGKVYNLRGQRVERMVKGQVYILDGKKFMAK